MSADLFAEFGQPNSTSKAQPPQAPQPIQPQQNQQQHSSTNSLEDAFADLSLSGPRIAKQQPVATDARGIERDPNVLFDATTEIPSEDDEDEWGDFETADGTPAAQSEAQPNVTGNDMDLLGSSAVNDGTIRSKPPWIGASKTASRPSSAAPEQSATQAPSWRSQGKLGGASIDLLGDGSNLNTTRSVPQGGRPQVHASPSPRKQSPSRTLTPPKQARSNPTPIDLLESNNQSSSISDASKISHAEADAEADAWSDSWVAVGDDTPEQPTQSSAMEGSWDDEEWGEFEDAQPQPQDNVANGGIASVTAKPRDTMPKARSPRPTTSAAKPPSTAVSQRRIAPTKPSPIPVSSSPLHVPSQKASPAPSTSSPKLRPTNIPPPSILLALFSSLLEELRNQCLKSKQNPPHAHRIPPLLRTLTRVLVGRHQRWKRDVILSQSTRIGPSGSGRGMKLNSVNKNESMKEDREAVDVLARWKKAGAVLNLAAANAGGESVQVPSDPNPVANVRTAGVAEGAVRASHACALCGLKRDERVARIDDNAFDSFGEWWVEHWGHTDCKWFWEEYEPRLRRY